MPHIAKYNLDDIYTLFNDVQNKSEHLFTANLRVVITIEICLIVHRLFKKDDVFFAVIYKILQDIRRPSAPNAQSIYNVHIV